MGGDPTIVRLREWTAIMIATVIVLGTGILIWLTAASIDTVQVNTRYDRFKDLLLFVNPLLGVVVGYYFNKVSTEARAESAERAQVSANQIAQVATAAAQNATEAVQQVTGAQQEALTRANFFEQQATEQSTTLRQLADASKRFLASAPLADAASAEGNASNDERKGLEEALDKANFVLAQS